ncbi:AlpA family phage regulatory protein [Paucibacter sp. AS339]|uniref:helix-turn-helix transcriptional regulator n=1 Tax=Paucibacter hankyongi TaxID=3133434 RepID=UPI0030B6CB8A
MTETEKLIRISEVMASTGLAKSTLYAMQRAGEFPQSLALSRRCVAWRESEVQEFIASRVRTTND